MNNKDISLLKEILNSSRLLIDEISNSFKNILELVEKILNEKDCPYCKKNKNNSIDTNVLCPSCRRIFGHSFFYELWKESEKMYNNLVYVIGRLKEQEKDKIKIEVKKEDESFNIITCKMFNMPKEILQVNELIGIKGFLESDENDNMKVIVLKLTCLSNFKEKEINELRKDIS